MTSGWSRATRSLNWQLRHHLAVKSTKTGLPAASARSTASADQGCHAALRAAELSEESSAGVLEGVAASSRGAVTLMATTASTISAATTAAQRRAGQRPRNHPAIANNNKLLRRTASSAAPYACTITHASQMTV